jgi:hypothetical protein
MVNHCIVTLWVFLAVVQWCGLTINDVLLEITSVVYFYVICSGVGFGWVLMGKQRSLNTRLFVEDIE